MVMLLVSAVAFWVVGARFKLPQRIRVLVLGALYCTIVTVHVLLPPEHPLRLALGETAAPWLLLGGALLLVLLYRQGLRHLRTQVKQKSDSPPQKDIFSETELDRYARHIVLREIGGTGQRKLKQARVLVVGAGGLGSPALLYLAAAGVGTIGVIDDDVVSVSNLQRQVIHTDDRQGMPKVFSAEITMRALNPHVDVRPYNRRFSPEIAAELLKDYDLLLDGSDTFHTRQVVNAAAAAARVPLVTGALAQWEGQLTVYDPAQGAPCLECIFPKPPAPEQTATCAEVGIAGPLCGIIGTMMALEAIKCLTGAGSTLRGRMLLYDGLTNESRVIRISKRENCSICDPQAHTS